MLESLSDVYGQLSESLSTSKFKFCYRAGVVYVVCSSLSAVDCIHTQLSWQQICIIELGMSVLCEYAIAALFADFPTVCISHILQHNLSLSPFPYVGFMRICKRGIIAYFHRILCLVTVAYFSKNCCIKLTCIN